MAGFWCCKATRSGDWCCCRRRSAWRRTSPDMRFHLAAALAKGGDMAGARRKLGLLQATKKFVETEETRALARELYGARKCARGAGRRCRRRLETATFSRQPAPSSASIPTLPTVGRRAIRMFLTANIFGVIIDVATSKHIRNKSFQFIPCGGVRATCIGGHHVRLF